MKTLNDLKNDEALSTSVDILKANQRGKTAENLGRTLSNTPRPDTPELPETPVIIVFGLVGVGKTNVINQITRFNHPTGDPDNHVPCTESCYMQTGQVGDVEVCFIDTPGFGNPFQADREIFSHILQWLSQNVGTNRKITAALYFQSAMRKVGLSLQTTPHEALGYFVSFVGNHFSKNVGLVSTHWDVIEKPNAPLVMNRHWKKLLGKEARRFRLFNDEKHSVQVVKGLLKVKPDFIQAQKNISSGRVTLEGINIADGPPQILGAPDNTYEASTALLHDPVPETNETKANGLRHKAVVLVKKHWCMILIVAAVAAVGLGRAWYFKVSSRAVLTARVVHQARSAAEEVAKALKILLQDGPLFR